MKNATQSGAHSGAAARFQHCLAAAAAIVAAYRAEAPEGCDPQNVGGLTVADIPSKRPSLANVLLNACNPEETPIVTRMKKGPKLRQMDHKYFVELKPARVDIGATDGQDVTNFGKGGTRYAVEVRAQEFRRTYKVGQISQEIVEDAAVPDQMAKLRMDEGMEIWKDVETRIASSNASQEDSGVENEGSKMGGLGYLFSLAADSMADKPIETTIRMPSAQKHVGTLAQFTETVLIDMMEARRQACGHSSEFVFFCGTSVKRNFTNFANYLTDDTTKVTFLRDLGNVKRERTLTRGINFYEGDFGSAEIVIDDFLPSQKRAYGLDMDQMYMLPLGAGAEKKALPDLGGGPRELLKLTFAYKPGDVRAHLMVKPSNE
jgi:hypothetical protein